jgi:ribosomal protein S18 acetylase RimI-like enzyme
MSVATVNAVTIRPYQREDQVQVRWLHDRTPPAGSVAQAPQPWHAELDEIEAHFEGFWVAIEEVRSGSAIVGMTGLEDTRRAMLGVEPPTGLAYKHPAARLDVMRVAPERQGRGIGRKLLAAAIEHARQRGYASVILETTPQQEAAVRLYEAYGFVKIGRSLAGSWELAWFGLDLVGSV